MSLRTTFRTKLLLLTIVPLAVAQVVTLFAVMRTVQDEVREDARTTLSIGANVIEDFLAARSDQLYTSVSVLVRGFFFVT